MKLPATDVQEIPDVLGLNRRLLVVIGFVFLTGVVATALLTAGLHRDEVRNDLRNAAATAASMIEVRLTRGIPLLPPGFPAEPAGAAPDAESGIAGRPPARIDFVTSQGAVPMLALSSGPSGERRLVADAILRKSLELAAGPHVDAVLLVERRRGLITGIGILPPAMKTAAVNSAAQLAPAPGDAGIVRLNESEVPDIGLFDSLTLAAAPLPEAPYLAIAVNHERIVDLIGAAAIDTLLLIIPGLAVVAVLVFSLHSQEGRRRRLFEEMASQNMRYRLGLILADAGTLEWDLDSDDVYFSTPWLEMLGLKAERFKGRAWSWHQRIHPDDRERVLARYWHQVSQPAEPFEQTYRLLDVDGGSVKIRERAAIHRTASGSSAFIIVHERLTPPVQRRSGSTISFVPDEFVG